MQQPLFGTPFIATNNDILIHQKEYSYNVCQRTGCMQLPTDLISYNYVVPTPILQQRGLTPSVLKQELDTIELTANSSIKIEPRSLWILGCSALAGFICGIVGFIIYMLYGDSSGPFIIGFIGMFTLVIFAVISGKMKKKKVMAALDTVRDYVAIDLNEKYQQTMGIRWEIVEGKTLTIRTDQHGATSVQSVPYMQYCHISISCVAKTGLVGYKIGSIQKETKQVRSHQDIDVV